jgi:fatty-acyl-CoA synthase
MGKSEKRFYDNRRGVLDYCKGIAHYKVPKYWKFVDEFPMTISKNKKSGNEGDLYERIRLESHKALT